MKAQVLVLAATLASSAKAATTFANANTALAGDGYGDYYTGDGNGGFTAIEDSGGEDYPNLDFTTLSLWTAYKSAQEAFGKDSSAMEYIGTVTTPAYSGNEALWSKWYKSYSSRLGPKYATLESIVSKLATNSDLASYLNIPEGAYGSVPKETGTTTVKDAKSTADASGSEDATEAAETGSEADTAESEAATQGSSSGKKSTSRSDSSKSEGGSTSGGAAFYGASAGALLGALAFILL